MLYEMEGWWRWRRPLDAIHGLELAEGLHGVDVLLVGRPLDPVGLAVVLLLALHQRLLLGRLHLPGDGRHVERLHALVLLVPGGRHVRGLHRGHHGVHQVLGRLDEGHGAVQLHGGVGWGWGDGRGKRGEKVRFGFFFFLSRGQRGRFRGRAKI